MAGTKLNTISIQQQLIGWWLRDNGNTPAPSQLDEISVEYIDALIREGYREGELCVTSVDNETEFRGWWSKGKIVREVLWLKAFLEGRLPNSIPSDAEGALAIEVARSVLESWRITMAFEHEGTERNLVHDLEAVIGHLQAFKAEAVKILPTKFGGENNGSN